MSDREEHHQLTAGQVFRILGRILAPERSFYLLAIIYGIAVSLLTLATPIAVQVLINTVAYTGLTTPLMVLTLTLFALLLTWALLNALRVHLLEIFGRRFYARMVSEISLRALYAQNPFFADDGRGPLFNRYFDIVIIQKNVPVLFVGGFTIVLQMLVGFALVSFYHPLFLAFNVTILLIMWAIWAIWGGSAVKSAVELSHRKHQTAAWLEGLGASNGYYKSIHHVNFALDKTDELTGDYIEQHRKHFRRFFSQTVGFLVLYAAASAALLGLGGWLVINGQLTLGQLVAAELVLSTAFYGASQLGTYLVYFYDICASAEELSLILGVKQEAPSGAEVPDREDATLAFYNVQGEARGQDVRMDVLIPGGSVVQAAASEHGVQRLFTNLLKRFEEPEGGLLTLGGDDITATEVHLLRREVMVLDRPSLVEMPMRQYLALARENVTSQDMLHALNAVGLAHAVENLEDGLDTQIATTGWPLSFTEAMQLKLAAAVLARPQVLVLNQLYDVMPEEDLKRAVAALKAHGDPTVIVFSNRTYDLGLGGYLYLEPTRQRLFDRFDGYADALKERRMARPKLSVISAE